MTALTLHTSGRKTRTSETLEPVLPQTSFGTILYKEANSVVINSGEFFWSARVLTPDVRCFNSVCVQIGLTCIYTQYENFLYLFADSPAGISLKMRNLCGTS